ncbi:hypothetical protein [Corynebacterium lubricantis]|uniref:hypothetical protein n=1 Tax=Corynebacterium lubricantis TaxID=541095 RepID=UPI000360F939|nr:hypothetical protein [Corynebacterium lubricantis]
MATELLALNELKINKTKASLTNEYSIVDAHGTPVGRVEELSTLKEALRRARTFMVLGLDDAGNAAEPIFGLKAFPRFITETYEVHLPGQDKALATIEQTRAMVKTTLKVTMDGYPEIVVSGKFWEREFVAKAGTQILATADMSWEGFKRYLGGEIDYRLVVSRGLDQNQHLVILLAVVCLDVLHSKWVESTNS